MESKNNEYNVNTSYSPATAMRAGTLVTATPPRGDNARTSGGELVGFEVV